MPSQGLENERTAPFPGCIPRFGTLCLIARLAVPRELLLRLVGETVRRRRLRLGGRSLRWLLAVGGDLILTNNPEPIKAAASIRCKVLTIEGCRVGVQ